ncbi:MAG TPA: FtsX-like permease family protein [Rhizomicrobium sp.]|jgi:putative ABC transport system permease protein|nr:FtsX-like permease family protein [Rhizomicrobium sp.]
MLPRIGLGLRLLLHNRARLAVASASVAMGVVIVFVEFGLLLGMLDAQSLVANLVRGDLLIMNIARVNLHRWDKIDAVRLEQAAAVPGVARVTPVYEDHVGLRDPDDKRVRRIILYAFPPDDIPFKLADPAGISHALKISHGFLYDRLSRPIFGKFKMGDDIQIDTIPLRVDGYVSIGADIVNDGNILMSSGDWLSRSPDAKPIMGVIHLEPGVSVERERRRILTSLPPDVTVLTPAETAERESAYTLRSAPVGLLFAIGMLAGLIIGTINCYQVLYNEISDHLPQFATLKAMGFSTGSLRSIILGQAVVLSASGFATGLLCAWIADRYIAAQSMLPIRITVPSGLVVCSLTVAMCVIAGLIAIRRVAIADPAALY